MVLYVTIKKDAIDLYSHEKMPKPLVQWKKGWGGMFKIACIVGTHCFKKLKKCIC